MGDTIVIETPVATVLEVSGKQGPQGVPGATGATGAVGPAGPAGTGIETLTTKGDLLSRDDSAAIRVGIGTTGQVLKVSAQGLPAWANESGAVTSVNGQTGAVTVAAATHSHQPNDIYADAADVADTTLSGGEPNGIYFRDGSDNGKAIYKSAQGYSIWWDDGEEEWVLGNVPQTAKYYIGTGDTTYPWEATSWALGPQGSGDTPVVDQALLSNVQRNAAQDVVSTRTPKTGNASSTQIVLGNDTRLTSAVPTSRTISAGTGLTGGGDLTANRTLSVSFGSSAGTACEGNDARLSDSRNPLAHKNSHSIGQSDALAPSDIGAQSVFSTQSLVLTADETLTASRATNYALQNYGSGPFNLTLPIANNLAGDIIVVRNFGTFVSDVVIRQQMHDGTSGGPQFIALATIVGDADGNPPSQQYRFIKGNANNYGSWSLVPVDTHTHTAADITSGTLDIARIPTGTTAGTVAAGDHTHSQLHDRSHAITSTSDHTAGNHKVFYSNGSGEIVELPLGNSGEVLTSNGATSAPSFAAASGGGVTTGSVDNAVLRADGTGGSTSQSSDINIEDATTSTANNVTISNQHSGQTNSSLVLQPKGTGAFILGEKPAATSSSGNARGASAVDLQLIRTNAARVASGLRSALLGGANNTASGPDAVAIGGNDNTASGFQSAILGGRNNTASGDRTFAFGDGNTSSGTNAIAIGGNNIASSSQALAICLQSRADRLNLFAHGSGQFATAGDAQRIRAVLRRVTTNATATELFLDGASVRLTVPANKVISGTINIHGVRSDGSATAHFVRQFQVKNVAGTSSYPYTAATVGTDYASSTSITFNDPDTNGDALSVSVTGIASQTWRWTASVDAVETTYGT